MLFAFILALTGILFGGLIAILSVYALIKEKRFVDNEGRVVELELPFFGKLKTNAAPIAVTFIGGGLIVFCLQQFGNSPNLTELVATVRIEQPHSVNMVALAVVSDEWDSVESWGSEEELEIKLTVPSNWKSYNGYLVPLGDPDVAPRFFNAGEKFKPTVVLSKNR
ncbi:MULTISPECIES: hypothetical protein [unclassified Pseudovibrio]|uniref:hypothetical protein n=1 Tax=unclassified Pseudovibrio TaxID=2627060 RepID=UPI0007AEC1D7|nr:MULTISPECIES: hypothetical protein [unclassified Pseudovibrio]KZK94797.1 hypothetical protein PsW74_04459 [Pseudovibrio sp. W74]KZL04644.1 hypothetical protein PsAD14_04878 [Pseudovibrio sp. Ad14]